MICPMALHKFPKPKSFQVDYCGCTAAAAILNELAIRDAIHFIRQMKSKRDFVKTVISTQKDGVKIIYETEQQYTTHVPSTMIAGSALGKSTFHDTVGVVYISPLNGRHYPAFVHVYRCESSRNAQKLFDRLRAYLTIENHHLHLKQLEQHLIERNLLSVDHFNMSKEPIRSTERTTTLNSTKTNTAVSSSSASSHSRLDKVDPVKSITEELQKKIKSHEPLLFPPKDYDTIHAGHGHLHRAQAWKSTDPVVVGASSSSENDEQRKRGQTYITQYSFDNGTTENNLNRKETNGEHFENGERSRLSTNRNAPFVDPVETVSLAFDFLKDETESILSENDGNIEHLAPEQQDKLPIFRFRPPQITAINKRIFTRSDNHELNYGHDPLNLSPKNDLDAYYRHAYYQQRQNPQGQRTRSETTLDHIDHHSAMHLSPRYEHRLVNGSGAPISNNPVWKAMSPVTTGSQPNLLSSNDRSQLPSPREQNFSPLNQRRMTVVPLQHPSYTSYSNQKPNGVKTSPNHQLKRPGPAQPPPPPPPTNSTATSNYEAQRRRTTQSQYLDTNEFILRASDGQSLTNPQNYHRSSSGPTREYRSQLIDMNHTANTKLDVYY